MMPELCRKKRCLSSWSASSPSAMACSCGVGVACDLSTCVTVHLQFHPFGG